MTEPAPARATLPSFAARRGGGGALDAGAGIGGRVAAALGGFFSRLGGRAAGRAGGESAEAGIQTVVREGTSGLGSTRARLEFRGPANAVIRGGNVGRGPNAGTARAFVTDGEGRIVREITRDRVKVRTPNPNPVTGEIFETFDKAGLPTPEDLRILELIQ